MSVGEHGRALAASSRIAGEGVIKRGRGRALASVHETAKGSRDAGLLDEQVMREFDAACRRTRPAPQSAIGRTRQPSGKEGSDCV
jgi:hypothetical protein